MGSASGLAFLVTQKMGLLYGEVETSIAPFANNSSTYSFNVCMCSNGTLNCLVCTGISSFIAMEWEMTSVHPRSNLSLEQTSLYSTIRSSYLFFHSFGALMRSFCLNSCSSLVDIFLIGPFLGSEGSFPISSQMPARVTSEISVASSPKCWRFRMVPTIVPSSRMTSSSDELAMGR